MTPAAEPSMSHARLRLAAAAALFLGWIGYLAYLALTTTRPVVLSRPQFLAAQLDVIATVAENDGRPDPVVRVQRVQWAANGIEANLSGQTTKVANLPSATKEDGWAGPGV